MLALALLPALVGVLLTTSLGEKPDPRIAADRARQTSTAAADLLVGGQRIESSLAALAANPGLSQLADGIRQPERQLARRAFETLQGSDGAVVSGACITRLSDGRTTVLDGTGLGTGSRTACATGPLLDRASRLPVGAVARAHPRGTDRLLMATRLSEDFEPGAAVLSAEIDLDTLFARTSSASSVAPTAMLVDMQTSELITGSTADAATTGSSKPPPTLHELAVYVHGLLSESKVTSDSLARVGWVTTVAELWPTTDSSNLGLIHVWPMPAAPPSMGLTFALVILVIVALVGVVAFMRHLMRPFRQLEESQALLATLYREAREDSLHDGLTGMGNHRSFQEELARQVELSERDGVSFSLLLLDLDNLKIVNDREGHAEGDRLLTALANAMREALRETDRLFRIGGDEFAVLMPDTGADEAAEAAGRLRHYCLRPPTGERATPFSGGISSVPHFALEAGQVSRQADTALYWAKRHGRGFIEVFDPERDQLPDDPRPEGVSNAVYEMARSRSFTPVFQPIVDLRTGAVLGFEGLVRPEPGAPFADSSRLFAAAAATGRSVELDLACLEVVAAGARGISGDHIVSVNLSAKTLEVKDFDTGWLLNTLIRHGISPSRVIVELTERETIADAKRLQNNVRHLGEYGVRLAADDVGAGSAGLRMLAEVPFDVVKIDLSLVQDGAQHAASWAVLRSIRDLAWRQDAVVIGEGVETPEQLRALRQLDIPIGQGYLLGVPAPGLDVRPRDLPNLAGPADGTAGAAAPTTGPRRVPMDAPPLPKLPHLPEMPVHKPALRGFQAQAVPVVQS